MTDLLLRSISKGNSLIYTVICATFAHWWKIFKSHHDKGGVLDINKDILNDPCFMDFRTGASEVCANSGSSTALLTNRTDSTRRCVHLYLSKKYCVLHYLVWSATQNSNFLYGAARFNTADTLFVFCSRQHYDVTQGCSPRLWRPRTVGEMMTSWLFLPFQDKNSTFKTKLHTI